MIEPRIEHKTQLFTPVSPCRTVLNCIPNPLRNTFGRLVAFGKECYHRLGVSVVKLEHEVVVCADAAECNNVM